ncbi:MAG: AAA family ATPase [Bacteroidaceae bacterium]|nr:AAA family ATPase [Bacteroidaceae bacterium]
MYEYNPADVYEFARYIGAETHEKGNELFFKYCPHCQGGNNRDKETFSINLDTGAFKCFRSSCGYQGHFVELARDYNYRLEDIEEHKYRKLPQKVIETKPKAIEYLENRGISPDIVRKYNITTRKDNDDILVFPFYDEQNVLQFVKYRKTNFKKGVDKNKEWCETNTMPILFGMNHCEDFTRLVITEGQIDSLSLATAGIKNAVSVPTGASGFTWLANCWDWVNKFDEIVVFGDCEKGKITLIETLEKRLQKKVKCVKHEDYLCEKDANDILQKYGKDALIRAVDGAELREVRFVNRLATVESINLSDLPKIKTGIAPLDRVCGGLLRGHVVLLTGKRGEGKSTFMSQIVADAIEQDNAVFIYSGELPNYHFKNWLDLQIAGGNHIESVKNEYGDNEYYLSDETVKTLNKWYYDKAFIFDNSAVSDDEYEGLLKVITDSICRYDIKLVCIDNLMTAMDIDPSTDLYRMQSQFVKKLERLAQQYDVAIILVAHPKKIIGQFDNDSVSGSSDITNAVSFVFNYQRANDGDDCDSLLSVTKNRMNGKLLTGENAIKLYYSQKSKRIASNTYTPKEYSCFEAASSLNDCFIDELPL